MKNSIIVKLLIATALFFELFINIPFFGIPIRLIVFYTCSVILYFLFKNQDLVFKNYVYNFLLIYLFYVFIILFLSLFNGDFEPLRFFKIITSRIIPILFIVFIFSKIFMHTEYYLFSLNILISYLLIHLLFILFQYAGYDFAWNILDYINSDVTYLGDNNVFFEPKNSIISTPSGLKSFEVPAGYYLLSLTPLIFLINNKYIKFITFLLLFVSILIIGQRSVLIFSIFIIFLSFIFRFSILNFIIIILISIIFYLFLEEIQFINVKFERYLFEDSVRIFYLIESLEYIQNNFIFGGEINYLNNQYRIFQSEILTPHNFYLNTLLRGGIFAFLVSIYLTYKLIKILSTYLLKATEKNYDINSKNKYIYLAAFCVFLNSLMHNMGLNSFTPFFWWFFILTNFIPNIEKSK